MIRVLPTEIPDVKIIALGHAEDPRGYFVQRYARQEFFDAGLNIDFVQDNESWSAAAGTLRGLHFQTPSFAQTKLVSVLKGSILDVAVDIRKGSPTYGRHVSITLKASDFKQVLVPKGFAHGFCTLEANTLISYKVDSYYSAANEGGLLWNDASIAIDWPVSAEHVILSAKDATLMNFDTFVSPFTYGAIS